MSSTRFNPEEEQKSSSVRSVQTKHRNILSGGDEALMNRILPNRRLKQEDKDLMEETLQWYNIRNVTLGSRDCMPVTPSPPPINQEYVETQDEEDLIENLDGPTCSEKETEQQAAACSPHIIIIPNIATEKIQPLVVSFWDQACTADLTPRESRKILAKMFLEVIATLSDLILDAFRNTVFDRRVKQNSLQVSEEVVSSAVCPSLYDSFREVFGSTHESMETLFKMVSEEVTGFVNFVLCCSRTKGRYLMVPKERSYSPLKYKLKAIVHHARTMQGYFNHNVMLGSGDCIPVPLYSPPINQEYYETQEDEDLMEKILPSPTCSEKETEQQAADCSPHMIIIPNIATEKIQPLVVSFWDQACTADLTPRESRTILAKMFLEVIATLSDLILDAFRNTVFHRRIKQNSLQVSEEVVHSAVCPSLYDSFREVFGATHESMEALFKMVSEEVTGFVNSVLCCSRMKDRYLVVPKESSYSPPIYKLNAMVDLARNILCYLNCKVMPGSGDFIPVPLSPQPINQEYVETRDIIPNIATEKIQPLVVSFWDQASTANLTKHESRTILAKMFLEVIATLSDLILDAFKNTVFDRRIEQNSLQVSEEAVRSAVCPSLYDSFRAVLGSTHQSMEALFKIVSEEVTGFVNSVLCCSRTKDRYLMVPKESSYRTPKDNLKAMVRHARTMLRYFKIHTPPKQVSTASPAVVNKTSAPVITETSEEEATAPISRMNTGAEKLGRCIPWVGHSVHQNYSEGVEREEEQPMRPRDSKSLNPGSTGPRRLVPRKNTDPSIKIAIAQVEVILLAEAIKLSGEERNLRSESLQTASAIIKSITDELSCIKSISSSTVEETDYITEVEDKIESFLMLCYAKSGFRKLLNQCLSYSSSPGHEVCLEEVMEESFHLMGLLVTMGNTDKKGLNRIPPEDVTELSEVLTDIISTHMVPPQSRPQVKEHIRMKVLDFTKNISNWLHMQKQLPDLKNPVQRAMGKIRRLVFRMSGPAQATPRAPITCIKAPVPHSPQPINQEYVRSSEAPFFPQVSHILQEHVVAGPPVPSPVPTSVPDPNVLWATSERQDPLPILWSKNDFNMLIYEVVWRILQKKTDPHLMKPLSQDLMTKLCENVSQWNVLVKPGQRSCQKLASAVHKELCKGQKKIHVAHAALVQRDFSSDVLDVIHQKLTTPKHSFLPLIFRRRSPPPTATSLTQKCQPRLDGVSLIS